MIGQKAVLNFVLITFHEMNFDLEAAAFQENCCAKGRFRG